ncbi:nucleolar complex protein 2-like protein [Cucumis melo var. makuwa]|uniref:Nucleolar complex protein 2-like protein n=1 Tax=Cucumis melo var. makuwa TaxID=1194695 RepID=A0A5D3CVA0_CUCMM|nr:nucleolar complex protein 2-like protein [Cucumis melo var. makuwa]
MGKLGKKARKFAKKNLQTVLRRKRKLKSSFKKKAPSRQDEDSVENKDGASKLHNRLNGEADENNVVSLEAIFSEDEYDMLEDDSDSDGYISEEPSSFNTPENEIDNSSEGGIDMINPNDLSDQNKEIHSELTKKIKHLNSLEGYSCNDLGMYCVCDIFGERNNRVFRGLDRNHSEDPEFLKFLETYKAVEPFRDEDTSSDEETINADGLKRDEQSVSSNKNFLLSSSVIDSWCHQVKNKQDLPLFTSLINGYRAACHYGSEAIGNVDAGRCYKIVNSETFSKILIFMLSEADNLFREQLGLLTKSYKKEMILELRNTQKWKTLKPLIKSYLRSSLFLLNEVSETEILRFSLARIRVSVIFFAAFPSLQRRLIKAIHLWATGEGTISSLSFLIIREMSSVLGSNVSDTCWIKMYKAVIGNCQFAEPILHNHMQFLRDSFVELCSLDVHRSTTRAKVSIQQLTKILNQGLRMKKKEAVQMMRSWQFINCIDLWVKFIGANFQDYDLQTLLYNVIQIINGVAVLFPGPRYLPLRIKCIKWLNYLSRSSGIFIPVASMVLDILEHIIVKEGKNPGVVFHHLSVLQLPKYWLKSQNFVEECVLSTIELLSSHFSQWSHHISFPELATIPLIQLKKFHATSTTENLKRLVKRFIDQVEQNIDFIKKKRDEISFSPNDQQAAESFLQLEKCNSNVPFIQYYKSILDKAASRSLAVDKKDS